MKAVTAKKRLGQHFLIDLSIAKDIADTVDTCPGMPILEVGPGMGVLTRFLIEKKRPLKVVDLISSINLCFFVYPKVYAPFIQL